MLTLQEKDYVRMNDNQAVEGAVKIVVGPGTGLGQGLLCKGGDGHYEVFPSEGGHVDFTVRTREDFELLEYARDFIEHSDNEENLRSKGPVTRVSIERLCAGPALPLIYDFMSKKNPQLERTLETKKGIHFNKVSSSHVVEAALKEDGDPLCKLAVRKFAEIFGVEVGNTALKTLPYGGIYLTGGVTAGIQEFLLHDETFLEAFYAKGRQANKVRKMPIFIVKPELQLGLLGAEECARRVLTARQ